MQYTITAPSHLQHTAKLPASKSISNRALIIHALSGGKMLPENLSNCDDTEVIVAAMRDNPYEINIKAAGTAMRFMTAYLAVKDGEEHVLTGTERMKHRPISVLVDALRFLGADIQYVGEEGFQFAIYLSPADDSADAEKRTDAPTDWRHHLTSVYRPDAVDDARIRS